MWEGFAKYRRACGKWEVTCSIILVKGSATGACNQPSRTTVFPARPVDASGPGHQTWRDTVIRFLRSQAHREIVRVALREIEHYTQARTATCMPRRGTAERSGLGTIKPRMATGASCGISEGWTSPPQLSGNVRQSGVDRTTGDTECEFHPCGCMLRSCSSY